VARGLAPDTLLDTYTAERRPVAETVLRNTRAQVAPMRPSPQVDALREVLGEVLAIPEAMRHFGALANGTGIDYAPDAVDPPVGRFAADLDPALLADGRCVLLVPDGRPDLLALAAGYPDRLRIVPATHGPRLVRPDGYIAWTGAGDLAPVLARWLGPTPPRRQESHFQDA
jgi:hypothetical protein